MRSVLRSPGFVVLPARQCGGLSTFSFQAALILFDNDLVSFARMRLGRAFDA